MKHEFLSHLSGDAHLRQETHMVHKIKCPHCHEPVKHTSIRVSALTWKNDNTLKDVQFLCPHCGAILGAGIGGTGTGSGAIATEIKSPVSTAHSGHPLTRKASGHSAADLSSPDIVKRASRVDWPVMRNQHELEEVARLMHKRAPIYPQQGRQIGEILKHYGIIDEQVLQIVRSIQKRPAYAKKPLGETLVDIGIISAEELTRILLIQAGRPMVELQSIDIPAEITDIVPLEMAREKHAVSIGKYHKTLYLAVSNPFILADRSFFTVMTGMKIEFVFAPMNEIIEYIDKHDVSMPDDGKVTGKMPGPSKPIQSATTEGAAI